MIICGHCRMRHSSVAKVRECADDERTRIEIDLDAEAHIERLLESREYYGIR